MHIIIIIASVLLGIAALFILALCNIAAKSDIALKYKEPQ